MSYKKFVNKNCEYFPCHDGVKDEEFNCMFCYCPLYFIECPLDKSPVFLGSHKLLKNGLKDCTNCSIPHKGERAWNIVQEYISKHWRKM